MDFLKLKTKRFVNEITGKSVNFDTPKGVVSQNIPSSVQERMVRRYSSALIASPWKKKNVSKAKYDMNAATVNADETTLSGGKSCSKGLTDDEINKKRLAELADLMTVFADEEGWTSDQDDLIDELQDIGYIIAPKKTEEDEVDSTNTNHEDKLVDMTDKVTQENEAGFNVHCSATGEEKMQQMPNSETVLMEETYINEAISEQNRKSESGYSTDSISDLQTAFISPLKDSQIVSSYNLTLNCKQLYAKAKSMLSSDSLSRSITLLSSTATPLSEDDCVKSEFHGNDTSVCKDEDNPYFAEVINESPLLSTSKDRSRNLLHLGIPVPRRPISGCIKDLIEEKQRKQRTLNPEQENENDIVSELHVSEEISTCTKTDEDSNDSSNEKDESCLEQSSETKSAGSSISNLFKLGKKLPHFATKHCSNEVSEQRGGRKKSLINFVMMRRFPKRTGMQDAGIIELRIQFLIMTERLKVTIVKAENLISSNSNSLTTFAQVSLMPGKMQKQSTKCVKNSNNPEFTDEQFFFTGINLEDMHLMTLRVQIMRRKFLLKVPKCIGEAYVPLFNVDLVSETSLRERLRS